MAQQAVSSFLIIAFLSKEPPIDRHSTRIAKYSSTHTPKQQWEEDMEKSKANNIQLGFKKYHVAIDIDKIVEADEDKYSCEVWVN